MPVTIEYKGNNVKLNSAEQLIYDTWWLMLQANKINNLGMRINGRSSKSLDKLVSIGAYAMEDANHYHTAQVCVNLSQGNITSDVKDYINVITHILLGYKGTSDAYTNHLKKEYDKPDGGEVYYKQYHISSLNYLTGL